MSRSRPSRPSRLRWTIHLAGLVLVGLVLGTPGARGQTPNPVILSQFDVVITSGTFTRTIEDLNVGRVHHLDVDGDGGGSASGCGDYFELGEVAGRCEDNPDITIRATIETSFANLLTVPTSAPVIRINRAPSAVIEGRPAPPLEILTEFTVSDTTGIEPLTLVRFGYSTPPGGTIPARLTGIVGGLEPPTVPPPPGWQPFNPVEIVLDSGQFTTLSGVAGVPPTYSGPLTVLGGVTRSPGPTSPALDADIELAYRPLPERMRVIWSRDDAQHRNTFTYEHDAPGLWEHFGDPVTCPAVSLTPGCPRDVDLTAQVTTTVGSAPDPADNEHLDVTARIDRLPATPLRPNLPDGSSPPRVTLDMTSLVEEGVRTQGTADLLIPVEALSPTGRLPDAAVDVRSQKPSDPPGGPPQVQVVHADVEQVPNHLRARWYLPVKPTGDSPGCTAVPGGSLPPGVTDPCLAKADFEVVPVAGASAPHVGAVELRVANFDGTPASFTPHVPEREQYVNLQSGPVGPGSATLQQLLSARVERIRSIAFAEQPDGFTAESQIGDGAAPLELHIGTDERTRLLDPGDAGPEDDEFGQLRDITALVSPLPDDITVDVQLPDAATQRPLAVAWDATGSVATSVDLDADIAIREQRAAEGAACGEPYTVCATAAVDHIPVSGTVTFTDTEDQKLLAVDTVPEPGGERPDLVADFALRPSADSAPFVGHVDIRRLPAHVTARVLTPLLPAAEGETPERGLTRFQVHPCAYDFDARACTAGGGETFGALTFNIRDFLVRPPALPHVPIVTTPAYLSAALRDGAHSADVSPVTDSLLFEVEGHFTEVAELQYLNPGGVIGGRVRAGDGTQPFTAAVDVGAVVLSEGDDPTDLRATATLHTLPTELDLCFRSAGEALGGEAFDPEITATCEQDRPFGDDVPLEKSPLSLALDANADFVLDVDFEMVDRGPDDALATDDATVVSRLHVDEVPRRLSAHVQTPTDGEPGPVRALFDTAETSDPVDIDFAAEIRDGELFCTDPRLPPEVEPAEDGTRQFQEVLCLEGTIENLPTYSLLTYDPSAETDNFRFFHDGGTEVNIRDLLLTSVRGGLDDRNVPETPEVESDDTHVADVLVAEGSLEGLPPLVVGDIVLPGTVEIRSADPDDENAAGTPVERVMVTVRNYLAPDPMPANVPTQRAVEGVELPAADQNLVVFQRDQLFKAIVDVGTLVRAGFATARDVDGNLLDTNVIAVDFGRPRDVIRAYADLQLFTDPDDPATPDIDEHQQSLATVIGDVTLQEKPAGVTVCFRGENLHPGVPPAEPTFCDTTPADDEGAFQFLGRPFDTTQPDRLDVDAFIRYGRAGGTDVLAATTHIDDVPLVVQGTYGADGQVDVGGFELNDDGTGAAGPDGIDRVTFELANFDLKPAGHGYDEDPPPWGNLAPGFQEDYVRDPLSDHFLRVKVHDDQFFLQGGLGVAGDAADSELQRVFLSSDPCAPSDPAPADYPHFPTDLSSSYSCVRGFFDQVDGGTTDPLLLEVTVDDGDDHFTLNGERPDGTLARAGLTRIPTSFAATFAETSTQASDTSLRPPCGPATDHAPDDVSCMPPLLRLDVDAPSGADPAIFGVIETGSLANLDRLRGLAPQEPIAGADGEVTRDGGGLHESPGADGFVGWTDGHGARVRVGSFDDPGGGEGTTVIAGLHLPVTASLTVDQLQTFDCEDADGTCPDIADPSTVLDEDPGKAKDLRIHYAARGDDGAPVTTIGELALMVVDGDGAQILVADPDDADNRGVALPGELGLALYQRDGWDEESGQTQLQRKFMQIDGRISHPMELGARIFGDEVKVVHAQLRDMPTIPAGDTDPLSPSFRLRLEVDKLASTDTSGPTLGFSFDVAGVEVECAIVILYCTGTRADLNRITADIDFEGQRRVDAFVNVDKPQNAIEMRGYAELHGTSQPRPIGLSAAVDIDPLFIFLHVGVPVIAGADLLFWTDVDASLDYFNTTEARWRNDLTRIKMDAVGSTAAAGVELSLVPYAAAGVISVLIPVFVPFYIVWGFGYVWPPTVDPPVDITYIGCSLDELDYDITDNRLSLDRPGSVDVYADVSFDPRFVQFGTTDLSWVVNKIVPGASSVLAIGTPSAPLMTIFGYIAGCAIASADLDLIEEGVTPGPPFAIDTHPVPGFGTESTVVDQPPPPEPPPPPLTVDGPIVMCGRQMFASVTVEDGGTITVGSTAGPYCPGGSDGGSLDLLARSLTVRSGGTVDARDATGLSEVFAETITVESGGQVRGGTQPVFLRGLRRVQVDGSVTADGVATATSVAGGGAATGNSGAGHGRAGGDGSSGSGGDAYGDHSLEADIDTGLIPSETGAAGVGPVAPGTGGGLLHLTGSTVRISGTVAADGTAGADNSAVGACEVPAEEEGELPIANTGVEGAGGGSGGAVVVSGQVVDLSGGALRARGGAGGSGKAGGGGGGAGGIVKVVAPVLIGSPQLGGGGGGGNGGCPESDAGDAGGDGRLLLNDTPSSYAAAPTQRPFTSGVDLAVPYAAAAKAIDDSDDFQVVLCGLHRPPEAPEEAEPDDAEGEYGIDMPDSGTRSVTNPCGSVPGGSDTSRHELGSRIHVDTLVAPEDATITAASASGDRVQIDEASGNGYWGFYTIVLKPSTPGNNCLDADNPFEVAFDSADCSIEDVPTEPDTIIGVDNSPPEIASFSAPTAPSTQSIQLTIGGVTDSLPRQTTDGSIANTSGVDVVECSNDGTTWKRCGVGIIDWELTDGSGPKTVHVRAIDRAGNVTQVSQDLTLDITPPDSQVELIPAAPDGSNGWYTASPQFRLHGFTDAGGSGAADPPYEFWFDGGTHRPCPDESGTPETPVCLVDDGLPGIGSHTFNWQAIDDAGHRHVVKTHGFKVDGRAPLVELLTAPFSPDADNGWFGLRPFVVVSAFDQPGGSGLVPVDAGDGATGVFLGIDGAAPTRQDGPVRLDPGAHELCYFARDVAGNASPETCEMVLVDDEQPTVAITTAPSAPDGGNGWFVTEPTITVTGADASSAVDPAFDGTADLCGPLPAVADPDTPSGLCVSYDGEPYEPFTVPRAFTDDGTHIVRAFSVDLAGKRSALASMIVQVDLAAPATLARTEAPLPAVNGRFRAVPLVALAAAEPQADNAGVDMVEYRMDGGAWTPYTAPFPVPEGDHVIGYRARDRAGNVEPEQTLPVIVDTTPPTADAIDGTPNPWTRPDPPDAQLNWTALDQLSDTAHVSVLIYGAESPAQSVVLLRRLEHSPGIDPSPSVSGSTAWEGSKEVQTVGGLVLQPVQPRAGADCPIIGDCLDSGLPLSGRYWFDVVVTDEAGNITQTDESAFLQINAL